MYKVILPNNQAFDTHGQCNSQNTKHTHKKTTTIFRLKHLKKETRIEDCSHLNKTVRHQEKESFGY